MITTPENKIPIRQAASVLELMQDLVDNTYPKLSAQITTIVSATYLLQPDHRTKLLAPLAEKISNEVGNLFQMEKEALIHFISTAAEKDERNYFDRLFKTSRVQYTLMLREINELKVCLKICNARLGSPALLRAIIDSLQVFERQHIFVQARKDRYFFAQMERSGGFTTN